MKGNKHILAALTAALSLLLCSCTSTSGISAPHTVTLIAKSTQTEFWLSVFAGAEAAATEYNLDLNIVGPDAEEDYETQNQMVDKAVQAGTEALVFSAIHYDNNADAIDAAAQKGVKIVAIDSNVDSQAVSTYIGTDNYAAGQMAAQAALARVEGPFLRMMREMAMAVPVSISRARMIFFASGRAWSAISFLPILKFLLLQ